MPIRRGTYPASNPARRIYPMATDDPKDRKPRDADAHQEGREEGRETGFEYGANEIEQTRERERALHDRTDEAGELP